ncbi:MAG: hypothetical protein UIC65_05290 [Alphaproteobacteria bacterium]|nr:hypothetical protein [Alphaproteobacteria bacterium]
MKKLTAGIFATILGLTAVDAFAAVPTDMTKVATTNYVAGALNAAKSYTDSAVAGKADKSTTYTKDEVDGLVGNVNTSLEGYVTTQTYNTDQGNQNTAIQAAQKTATDAATAASAADTKAQTAQNEVDALELVVADKANASDLTGYVAWTDVENEYPTQQ